jgi:hypothetical protein
MYPARRFRKGRFKPLRQSGSTAREFCGVRHAVDLEEYFDQDDRYIKLDLETYLQSKYVVKNVTGYIKYGLPLQKRWLIEHKEPKAFFE